MPASRLTGCGATVLLAWLASASPLIAATVTARPEVLGGTPGSIAYNSGHFVPASNTRDWWHYAGVNSAC